MNKRAKNFLLWGGWLVIILVLCKNKTFLITIFWIFAWSGFVGTISWLENFKRTDNKSVSESDPRLDTPRKVSVMLFNYQVSNLFFLFNPLLVTQSLLQIIGTVSEKIFGHPVLEAEQYKQKM